MGIFICKICQKECNGISGIQSHNALTHKLYSEETYVEYVLNGIKPKCECGCGDTPPFITCGKGYSRFVRTHHNRVKGKNNFHKNPETKIKSAKTQSENWSKGMYRRWWEEDTEETKNKIEGIKEKLRNDKVRGKKISDKLLGIPKTEESKIKLSITQKERYKNNPQLIKNMSIRRLKWMRDNSKVKTSNLENKFIVILDEIGLIKDVDYIHNHLIENIKTFFDFYLPTKKIIIEVDGDYYHCNPNSKFSIPKYEMQFKNISNDKRKNTWCKNHNIKLLRYWEKDVNERPEWVINDLKEKLT
jgi:very-short-patch-repair endonuclease